MAPNSKDNLSAVLYKAGDIRLEQMPLPGKPGPTEVLLQTHSVGICGSDVHYWVAGRIGDFVVKAPMILGHETSATVVEVGEKVKNLKPGDRVAVEPGVPCRHCDFCKGGCYNLCPDVIFAATPPDHGTLTRYFKHAADFCFKLPEHVSYEEGALMEPLSVGVQACRRANLTIGQNALVCGAGPIGLVSILVAKAFGASKICVTDVIEKRLKLAKELGADETVLIGKEDKENDIAKKITEHLGAAPDVVIECTGFENSIRVGLLAAKNGGTLVLVGMGALEVRVPLVTACCKEVDIRGVFRYKNCYPLALELIASGKVNVKPLVTHKFKLEETLAAFEMARSGEAIKVMIQCHNN